MAKFSVILPVLNNERYLKQCLDNILNQSFNDFEIICIDDGSTDNSLPILQEAAKEDSRIKIMTQIQKGMANAKNLALNSATGEYCYFANPKDLIAPSLFEYADKLFSTFDMDCFCFGSKAVKDENAITVNVQKEQEKLMIKQDGLFDATFEIAKGATSETFNKIFKMSVIKNNNITFPTNTELDDLAFTWMFNFVAKRIYFDDYIYLYHKVPTDNLGQNYNYAISYLHSWCYMCEQTTCVRGLVEANYDALIELLNYYAAKAKTYVLPTEKMKIEKVKQEYKDKLDQVVKNAQKAKQWALQIEQEQNRQLEKYKEEQKAEPPVEAKKTFFQKIFSILPDVYRKNSKILTIFGIEILLRKKN